ncbi:hypothetical protein HAHE_26640 [Haloferula helveola]|uniref:DUF642 domain-containing protein n=1 Tax=Haloferula helveola TaxID=490095 RepID=A0ABM7RNE9_9BACT|nr:hypothetical protein HAHE_26640 [Haloferula helveola]
MRFLPVIPCLLARLATAAPVIVNPGFESDLDGWTHSGVAIETTDVHEGLKSVDLQGGWIEQAVTGLTPGQPHLLSFAYQDTTESSNVLSHAAITIDGIEIATIHNGQSNDTAYGKENEFVSCNVFEFVPASATATLRVETLDSASEGFRVDSFSVTSGTTPLPPSAPWASLDVMTDARGGRQLVNGGFESTLAPAAGDPCNAGPDYNPHVSGFALPGWRVTQENVDVLFASGSITVAEGSRALDVGGHGPGGIAQTVTGLVPGAVYTLSFEHARHIYWGTDDMTGELLSNGRIVADLVRTIDQDWNDGYEIREVPMLADSTGSLTVEIRSTVTDRGGNIIYDDIRLSEGGDALSAWAAFHGVTPDGANHDDDPFDNVFEFLLGLDPLASDSLIVPQANGGAITLEIPLNGAALDQGYDLQLLASTDLVSWPDAATLGVTVFSDTSGPSTSGSRTYQMPSGSGRLFLRMQRTDP